MSHPPKQWFTWQTKPAFDTWHQTVIDGLELPQIGHNAKTGDPDPEAAWTTAYTTVTEVAADDWRAPVEDHIATEFSDGLGQPSEPPPPPEDLHV
jgi:hypothetical protein